MFSGETTRTGMAYMNLAACRYLASPCRPLCRSSCCTSSWRWIQYTCRYHSVGRSRKIKVAVGQCPYTCGTDPNKQHLRLGASPFAGEITTALPIKTKNVCLTVSCRPRLHTAAVQKRNENSTQQQLLTPSACYICAASVNTSEQVVKTDRLVFQNIEVS